MLDNRHPHVVSPYSHKYDSGPNLITVKNKSVNIIRTQFLASPFKTLEQQLVHMCRNLENLLLNNNNGVKVSYSFQVEHKDTSIEDPNYAVPICWINTMFASDLKIQDRVCLRVVILYRFYCTFRHRWLQLLSVVTHLSSRIKFPTLINWTSPFPF